MPLTYYQQQKEKYTITLNEAIRRIDGIVRLRLWLGIAAIIAIIYAFRSGNPQNWWLVAAAVIAFIAIVRRHLTLQDQKNMIDINLLLIENELKALHNDNTPFPDGSSYIDTAHPYSYDLDIFGRGSVYQLLCRAVTHGGAASLARRLSSLVIDKDSITERQRIIAELSTTPDLLQALRVAGMSVPEGPNDQMRVKAWLQAPDAFLSSAVVRIAVIVMPALSIGGIIWSVIDGSLFAGFGLIVIINWVLLGSFQKKIKLAVQQIGNTAPLIDKYAGMLSHVAGVEFTTPWLQTVSSNATASVKEINAFKKLVHAFDSRSNGMTGPLMNTLFLFDLYSLIRLEGWRKKHSALLINAIDDMVTADVYISCAVYAFNHPENIYPEIDATAVQILATGLRHPLMPYGTAVGNDISIGRAERFYLLTGANMTGKSTFIRTIGVSNVMANLGLPLPATSLTLPLLHLYTSMRITDSVQDDISYFRAELNRIKAIMDTVRTAQQPYLVLLDEPLRGTNSMDKQQGTRAIVESLITCNAIGIVATHDIGLCDMEDTLPGKVRNYHFESTVEKDGLAFDFTLRPGASTSNNATILMRQMGIVK